VSATHVISTAGHVDHGKSTLVRALTGTDPDRFAEEKERGLTIDLGFAATKLPSGRTISLVDVPGHIRFLKNMLAGVGAVDACLFVVAAPEGWMPQSEEHLRILELLGTGGGVIALTQIDLVDQDTQALARMDIEEHIAGTFLQDAPIVGVDSISGNGIADLLAALDVLVDTTPQAADNKRPRLWIDRAFAAKGAGTVVTGTLTGGRVRVDDEMILDPQRDAVRIRGIQNLHENRTKIGPGNRVALNLSGVAHHDVQRGNALTVDTQWHRTSVFDASLRVLDSLDHPVSRRGAHVVYLGAGEHAVVMRVLGPNALQPGDTGFVRIRLPRQLPLLPGDRFILRESGRSETIGGGEVLDVDPQTKASVAAPDKTADRVIRERGWVDAEELMLLTGEKRTATIDRWVVDPDVLDETEASIRQQLADAGPLGLELAQLSDQHRALAQSLSDTTVDAGRLREADAVDTLVDHDFLSELKAAPFRPPAPTADQRGDVREMVRRGLVIEADGLFFSSNAVDRAIREVGQMLQAKPGGVTVAEIREHLGTSRKFALPLLAHMDTNGITRRREDVRIAGPRMPDLT